MDSDGSWYEDYLGKERLLRFLSATQSDAVRAIELIEWDREMRGELQKVLGEWEIALRNAYDLALRSWWQGDQHWLLDPAGPVQRPILQGNEDINAKTRITIGKAAKRAGKDAPIGKVIANLTLDFWRYLSVKSREKSLWVPALHRAFPKGTDRGRVDRQIDLLYRLRNRIAHHEPIFHKPIQEYTANLVYSCELIRPPLSDAIQERASIATLWHKRPV